MVGIGSLSPAFVIPVTSGSKDSLLAFVNCTIVAHAVGNTKDGNCSCKDGLVYLRNSMVCAAGMDCSNVPNSPGTNFNASICDCYAFYKFVNWTINNKTSQVCRRDCRFYKNAIK